LEIDPGTTTELLLQLPGTDQLPERYRVWRIDWAWRSPDRAVQLTECNLEPLESTALIGTYSEDGLEIDLFPIVWNAIQFRLKTVRQDWNDYESWYDRWLDRDELRQPGRDHLSGVVHHASQPRFQNKRVEFQIDFGSAPMEAFEELIELIRKYRIASLQIGSFDFTTAPKSTRR
jgi:hypothetical protein